MHVHRRAVRFEDVDAAGIVFFGAHVGYVHDAMESFFSPLEGGYPALITRRRVGFPAVALQVDYQAPLRYGDVITIEMAVARLGSRSVDFTYRLKREDVLAAAVLHKVVCTDLEALRSTEMPPDVRRLLEVHAPTP